MDLRVFGRSAERSTLTISGVAVTWKFDEISCHEPLRNRSSNI